jgi:gluconokinase
VKPRAVIMGVSGCGKTYVGTALAGAVGASFLEGDEFHPPENIALMSGGRPLDDAHRAGWLDAIGVRVAETAQAGHGVIASCSALKRVYRDRLRRLNPGLVFLYLAIDKETARRRVAGRKGHFMPASLVDSQFATLEPLAADEAGITLDGALPREQLVERAAAFLRRSATA